MCGLASQHLPVSRIAYEPAVFNLNTASDHNRFCAACDWPSFKRRIVDIHLLSLGRNRPAMVGIEDNKIGIGARLNGALSRKQSKKLGCLSRSHIHKAM